jgi:NADP-dependent 3-hydroxy acid dehydrogenase YdfG
VIVHHKKIQDSVVVITGVSSRTGHAVALSFARRGANLILAAPNWDQLSHLILECEGFGSTVICISTDFTSEHSIQNLAQRAISQFGSLDIWVNNLAELPKFHSNLKGNSECAYVQGARVALSTFKKQGCGVLINNAMTASKQFCRPPFLKEAPAQSIGQALSEDLRQEFGLNENTDIRICTLVPSQVSSKNMRCIMYYFGIGLYFPKIGMGYLAESIAETIVQLVRKPQNDVFEVSLN